MNKFRLLFAILIKVNIVILIKVNVWVNSQYIY